MELNSLDSRYQLRKPIQTLDNLGTIDIDAATIRQSGSWPISRGIYAEMMRVLKTYDAKLMSFDVFFPDSSVVELDEERLNEARGLLGDGETQKAAELMASMGKGGDEEFEKAMRETELAVLAQTFTLAVPEVFVNRKKISDDVASRLESMSDLQKDSLEMGKRFSIDCSEEAEAKVLWARATGVEPPHPKLMAAGRALGFAQVLQDVDGVVRRYPAFILYDGRLYPSIGLMSACIERGVDVRDVEVLPGECVLIPGRGGDDDLRIPIDRHLRMLVNWAGGYADSFTHLPASIVLEFRAIEVMRGIYQKYREKPGKLIDTALSEAVEEVVSRKLLPKEEAHEKARNLLFAALVEIALEGDQSRDEFLSDYTDAEDVSGRAFLGSVWDQVAANRDALAGKSVHGHGADVCRMLRGRGKDLKAWWPLYFFDPISISLLESGEETSVSVLDLVDKILFVGLTAPGTHDYGATPFSSVYPMVGLHVNVANTILSGQFLTWIPRWAGFVISFLMALPIMWVASKNRPLLGAMAVSTLLAVYIIGVGVVFSAVGLWMPAVHPVTSGVLIYLAISVHGFFVEKQEKNRVRTAFSTYMTPAVVDQVLMDPSMLRLGGQRREMTVFFSDLAGFTTISEACSPEELVALLNDYLSSMTDIIFRHGGTLDKYEGDGIMAFWNAPLEQDDHAYRCCCAALDCVEFLEREMRPRLIQAGKPGLEVRVGVNTGQMIVGNMGSHARMDYTVMGDAVNLGARLETANKVYGTHVMISEYTREKIGEKLICREIDKLIVKGKHKPVTAFEIVGRPGKISSEKEASLALYNEGLVKYKGRDWDGAATLFKEAEEKMPCDGPSMAYIDRCAAYKIQPPPEDWDGVWILASK
jgi:class 3 adenylate cyclase